MEIATFPLAGSAGRATLTSPDAAGPSPSATHATTIAPVDAILRDGASIEIRPVTLDDRPHIASLFARMSPGSVRHRFFAVKRELSDAELSFLIGDGTSHVALAATVRHDWAETFLGVGRYIALDDVPGAAEVAFEVADAEQGRGIGTLLLDHLARIARSRGITRFRADVEADNSSMLEVFSRSGFAIRESCSQGIYQVDIPIADSERFLAAAAERERVAAGHSLRALFAPSSIAVIGASRSPGSIGRTILDNLIADGFQGPIYPVHPAATEIAARRCYPSIAAIGAPVDLAIIAVPAAGVEQVIRDCAAAGVRGVVVISAGFAEVSSAGRDVEHRLREIARHGGMRLVGPNCMGVLSTDPAVRLNATFSLVSPPAGNVSMATQSGALGLAMIDHARSLQLGIAEFASIGNKADVSVNDLLSYWSDDPRTKVIALYLESFGNPRAFARLAPQVARQRPIVAVKSGRSAAGTRAASSHSAALASLDVGIDALFAQTGVIRTDTLEQLFDVVALLSSQPVPGGTRIGVVTNAGGPGILLADACEAHGLTLPGLAPETLDGLRAILPAHAGLSNPIDMIASASAAQYEATIELVGRDPNVDAVVAIYIPVLATAPEEIARAIAQGAARVPDGKPVATVFMSSKGTPAVLASGPRGAIPSYSFPENAAMALAAAARYGAWRARPRGTQLALPADREQAIRAWVRAWQAGHPSGGWLALDEIAALLGLAGIPLAEHRTTAPTAAAAADAAAELGGPVVLKAIAPGLIHKSDAGGVALGLPDPRAVTAAAEQMRARFAERGTPIDGFIVQRGIARGVEALVGVTHDPSLGPLLVAGIGGVAVELYKDVAFRVTPVSDLDAAAMLDQLRGRALLDGFRGAPAADRAALIDVLVRISALVELVPELLELDLNPVIVHAHGAVAVDARLHLAGAARP
ncbi:MAG TPA: GNAT family N-acetyltransferase [Kofleriaceae bacterium]|nr:GNAT family N-acetyltransferase [Kofleriaceae bacterium]